VDAAALFCSSRLKMSNMSAMMGFLFLGEVGILIRVYGILLRPAGAYRGPLLRESKIRTVSLSENADTHYYTRQMSGCQRVFVKILTVHKIFTTLQPLKFREIYSKMKRSVV